MESIPCDLCSEKATVYFTQIIDGKMQKVNLCEKCAKEKGVTDPTGFALADLLFGIGQQQKVGRPPGRRAESCPQCGLTAEQLKKTGRVGCPKCYEVFSDSLSSILKAMHKGLCHHGKVPSRWVESRERSLRLRDLKAALDQAVAEERYEDAATFRDNIQAMEQPAGEKQP
ncbi:MAG: UvrB/UvrC motif-containing protein [Verrucomicrobiales bacterium]